MSTNSYELLQRYKRLKHKSHKFWRKELQIRKISINLQLLKISRVSTTCVEWMNISRNLTTSKVLFYKFVEFLQYCRICTNSNNFYKLVEILQNSQNATNMLEFLQICNISKHKRLSTNMLNFYKFVEILQNCRIHTKLWDFYKIVFDSVLQYSRVFYSILQNSIEF